MGEPTGFLKWDRRTPDRRPVQVRLRDWKEVYEDFDTVELTHQAGRCMDCGIPFCNNGCPLGNLIPDWNDLVYRDHWQDAIERLHATNNFPEFTGRLCPAPCESACVLGINQDPVTIKQVEVDTRKELDDPAVLGVLDKMVKQRRDSVEQFTKGGRDDLAAIEEAEIAVLETYLPAKMDDAELDALIDEVITATGAESVRDMGKVMGAIKSKAAGRADMGIVGSRVKERLGA